MNKIFAFLASFTISALLCSSTHAGISGESDFLKWALINNLHGGGTPGGPVEEVFGEVPVVITGTISNPNVTIENNPFFTGFVSADAFFVNAQIPNRVVGTLDVTPLFSGYVETGSHEYLLGLAAYNQGYPANSIQLSTAHGTFASPTAVALNTTMTAIDWFGYDGTDWVQSAAISTKVVGGVSSGIIPTAMFFNVMDASGSVNTSIELVDDQVITYQNLNAVADFLWGQGTGIGGGGYFYNGDSPIVATPYLNTFGWSNQITPYSFNCGSCMTGYTASTIDGETTVTTVDANFLNTYVAGDTLFLGGISYGTFASIDSSSSATLTTAAPFTVTNQDTYIQYPPFYYSDMQSGINTHGGFWYGEPTSLVTGVITAFPSYASVIQNSENQSHALNQAFGTNIYPYSQYTLAGGTYDAPTAPGGFSSSLMADVNWIGGQTYYVYDGTKNNPSAALRFKNVGAISTDITATDAQLELQSQTGENFLALALNNDGSAYTLNQTLDDNAGNMITLGNSSAASFFVDEVPELVFAGNWTGQFSSTLDNTTDETFGVFSQFSPPLVNGLVFQTALGTQEAPTIVTGDTRLLHLTGWAYNDTDYQLGGYLSIRGDSASGGLIPTQFVLGLSDASGTPFIPMGVDHNGDMFVTGASSSSSFFVNEQPLFESVATAAYTALNDNNPLQPYQLFSGYGSTAYTSTIYQQAQGSFGSPTASNNGDIIAAISAYGFDGENIAANPAQFLFRTGTVAPAAVSSQIQALLANVSGDEFIAWSLNPDGSMYSYQNIQDDGLGNFAANGTGGLTIPTGNTAEQITPIGTVGNSAIRYNTDDAWVEYWSPESTEWIALAEGSGGVTNVTGVLPIVVTDGDTTPIVSVINSPYFPGATSSDAFFVDAQPIFSIGPDNFTGQFSSVLDNNETETFAIFANYSSPLPVMLFQGANGSLATPTTSNDGDLLGALAWQGYDGTQFVDEISIFQVKVDGAVSAGIIPMSLTVELGNPAGDEFNALVLASDGSATTSTGNILDDGSSNMTVQNDLTVMGTVYGNTSGHFNTSLGTTLNTLDDASGNATVSNLLYGALTPSEITDGRLTVVTADMSNYKFIFDPTDTLQPGLQFDRISGYSPGFHVSVYNGNTAYDIGTLSFLAGDPVIGNVEIVTGNSATISVFMIDGALTWVVENGGTVTYNESVSMSGPWIGSAPVGIDLGITLNGNTVTLTLPDLLYLSHTGTSTFPIDCSGCIPAYLRPATNQVFTSVLVKSTEASTWSTGMLVVGTDGDIEISSTVNADPTSLDGSSSWTGTSSSNIGAYSTSVSWNIFTSYPSS